ncbi:MAG: hypothetical protein JSU63_06235 [Phycisphaerales bacterium]|nr:MAG: hypothetical protein JSU63_06235 [Phycisphaerales bacterium]
MNTTQTDFYGLCLDIRLDDVSFVPTYTYPFDLIAEGHRNGFDSGRQDLNLRLPAPKAGALHAKNTINKG